MQLTQNNYFAYKYLQSNYKEKDYARFHISVAR